MKERKGKVMSDDRADEAVRKSLRHTAPVPRRVGHAKHEVMAARYYDIPAEAVESAAVKQGH